MGLAAGKSSEAAQQRQQRTWFVLQQHHHLPNSIEHRQSHISWYPQDLILPHPPHPPTVLRAAARVSLPAFCSQNSPDSTPIICIAGNSNKYAVECASCVCAADWQSGAASGMAGYRPRLRHDKVFHADKHTRYWVMSCLLSVCSTGHSTSSLVLATMILLSQVDATATQ